ncbi:MAG: (Fe-S)-binding protein [Tepidisphaeraceae bacterium]|jgi:L-lactate dehydrogenase complex protein LldE
MTQPKASAPGPRVALFITCLTDQFFPRVGVAVTKILEHFGCEVFFPREQTCCGQPMFNNGFPVEAGELARRWVEIFKPYEYVVTPSGSCCSMVREHYPQLLDGSDVPGRTYEFVEFLEKVLKVDVSGISLPQSRKVAYHYTCHLRGLGIEPRPPRILREMGNVQMMELERADQCCGFGGTFAVKYPVVSGAIVEDKTDCIARSGAETLVCNDAGCTMNIAGMCRRRGMETRVVHLAELMAEGMGIDLDKW